MVCGGCRKLLVGNQSAL
ncbi:hypothetical protein FQ320_17190 [Oceaniovalibus sp. ACAM 378]|nr:hypothetical protein FQ320_17190 [Oceaniovalibus sp. ACAM 378]